MEKSSAFTVLPSFPGEDENSNLRRINEEDKLFTCVFCRSSEVNEVMLGPLYISDGVVTHYYCLLFSAGLSQKGVDRDGILGFFPLDILSEVRRATRLKCIYCHTIGAAIGCCDRRCKATFHFSCGLANGANYQFYGNFESFCVNHSKKRVLESIPEDLECPICRSLHESTKNIIVGSCCKSAVFHQSCIQQHAFTAGYFFKCPTCNSEASFIQDMKSQGIFVPEQDAAWEREPNAYQELLYQYSHCDAEICQCPRGRDYGASKGQWLLARCRICGSAGTHRFCGDLKTIAQWACAPCLEIESRTEKDKKPAKPKRSYSKASDKSTSSASLPKTVHISSHPSIPTAISITNGVRRKAKRTGVKATLSDMKVDTNSTKIHPACFDYFPHDEMKIQKYVSENKSIPDWRSYELQVEIVNIFSDIIPNPGIGGRNLAANVAKDKANMAQSIKKKAVPNSIGQINRKRKASSSTRKRSSWQKGVLKPRKRRSKSKSISISSIDQRDVKRSLNDSTTNDPIASQSSNGILEGIRRSQSSLMTWLSTTSEPAKGVVQIEKAIKIEPGLSDNNQIQVTEKRINGTNEETSKPSTGYSAPPHDPGDQDSMGVANGQARVNARRTSRGSNKYFLESPKRPIGTSSNHF